MKYMVKLLKFIDANILKYVTSINFSNFTMYFITLTDDGQY